MITHSMSWLSDWTTNRAPRGQFWIYFSAAVFFNFGFSVFFFLFNVYLLGFGFDERRIGLIAGAMAVGTLCGTIPAGIAAQRFGLRWTLTCGILLSCVGSTLRVLIPAQSAQLALAILCGIGLCTWGVCLSPAVAGVTTEQQRPSGFSLMFSSGIGVAGLGAFTAGRLPSIFQQHLPRVMSVSQCERLTLLFAIAVASLALLPISRLTLGVQAPRIRLLRPSTPFLRTFLPAMATWALVTGAFPPFASIYFAHHLGLSLQDMGFVLSLAQLVQFCAILAAPILFRRTGAANGIMVTQLVTAATIFALGQVHTAACAGWFYWAYTGCQCMNEPGIYSLLMDCVPSADRNGASSYTFFVSAASQIVASTAVGMLIGRFSYTPVLTGIALLAVAAAVLFRRLPATAAGLGSPVG